MSRFFPYAKIGEACTASAFLTNEAGYDVARLERVTNIGDAAHEANLLSGDQWQSVINLVHAAPLLAAALEVALPHLPTGVREQAQAALNELSLNEAAEPADPVSAIFDASEHINNSHDANAKAAAKLMVTSIRKTGRKRVDFGTNTLEVDLSEYDSAFVIPSVTLKGVEINEAGDLSLFGETASDQSIDFPLWQVVPCEFGATLAHIRELIAEVPQPASPDDSKEGNPVPAKS